MTGEVTVPILPCGDIDVIGDFYRMLGFRVTYRQTRPNPYTVVQRDDIALHFAGIPDFNPEESYGSCLVLVPDIAEVYEAFAAGIRSVHGKLLASGIPRMTRPRRRANTGNLSGFSVVDPGGNWIRFFPAGTERSDAGGTSSSKLGRAVQNAIVLAESKGDREQAVRILDAALTQRADSAEATDVVEALVYRAELAIAVDDSGYAAKLLARVRAMRLSDEERVRVAEALDRSAELERDLRS